MKFKFVTITTDNLDESSVFYNNILEMKTINSFSIPDGTRISFHGYTEELVELIEFPGPGPDKNKSNVSICFEVDDILEMEKNLISKNIKILKGPFEVPNGDKLMFILDPNNVEIEFIQKDRK